MHSRALLILRAAERPSNPWKNGGGLTREVIFHPPGSDLTRFDWRVSLAEIRAPGPFSSFPGIDRRMAVLAGRLSLSIGEGAGMIATPETPPLTFPGETAVFAEPCGGPVTDLNVMTRRGRFDSRLTLSTASEPRELNAHAGATLMLPLSDPVVGCPTGPLSLSRLHASLGQGESPCPIGP